ncbi:hypothetical protein [Nostoc sp. ChiQUE01b]|nr:hypothetical protein [Nostoc sp. ChiQUE01b]MDZ8259600.1 hypothetical protein [Nostoc sp. ChiQUE01b]
MINTPLPRNSGAGALDATRDGGMVATVLASVSGSPRCCQV